MERSVAGLVGLLAASPAGCAAPAAAARGEHDAASALIERLLPGRSGDFILESIPSEEGRDVFEIESAAGRIVLRGSSGVAVASTLDWYLKHHDGCHVSFCGDLLRLPDPPPPVPARIRRVSPYKYRYRFNYCAFSYAMAFWDWPRRERMIDWMALHGINMPLAVTGTDPLFERETLGLLPASELRGPSQPPRRAGTDSQEPLRVERPEPHHAVGTARQLSP